MQKSLKLDSRALLATFRRKCVECSGGSKTEVQKCQLKNCPLYEYRMGNLVMQEAQS